MMYYHFDEGPHKRGATVAATVVEDQLHFGVSICNPGDQFNKKLGRKIASGRAIKRPQNIQPLVGRNPKDVFFKHARGVATDQIARYGKKH